MDLLTFWPWLNLLSANGFTYFLPIAFFTFCQQCHFLSMALLSFYKLLSLVYVNSVTYFLQMALLTFYQWLYLLSANGLTYFLSITLFTFCQLPYFRTTTSRVTRYSESRTKSSFLTRSAKLRVNRLPLQKTSNLNQ